MNSVKGESSKRRLVAAVLALGLLAAGAGCGDEVVGSDVSTGAERMDDVTRSVDPGVPVGTAQVSVVAAERFLSALADRPFVQTLNFPSADIARMKDRTDAWLIGRLTDARIGDVVSYGETKRVCESEEGVVIDGDCDLDFQLLMVELDFAVDEVQALSDAESTIGRETITLSMPVGHLTDDFSRGQADASADAIIDAAPKGAAFTMFVSASDGGRLELLQPDAWALVGDDGRLSAISSEGAQGLAGIATVNELRSAVSS